MNTPVHSSDAPKSEGLRARKRRATENAIETSAVRIALNLGVEHVTVEAICEMADISRSTFFNYFPARDDAIVGRAIDIPAGTEAFSILNHSPDNLALGLFRLAFAAIGHRHVNSDVARLRGQLAAEQPEASKLIRTSLLESGFRLTTTAQEWLERYPQHQKLESPAREAALTGSLVHGVITAQMTDWILGSGDIEADESDFLRGIDDFRRLLG